MSMEDSHDCAWQKDEEGFYLCRDSCCRDVSFEGESGSGADFNLLGLCFVGSAGQSVDFYKLTEVATLLP